MSDKTCTWDQDDATTLVHNKKAIEAAMFLVFIVYTVTAFISEIKRGTQVRTIHWLIIDY